MSVVIHEYMKVKTVKRKFRKILKPMAERIKKAEANLIKRVKK